MSALAKPAFNLYCNIVLEFKDVWTTLQHSVPNNKQTDHYSTESKLTNFTILPIFQDVSYQGKKHALINLWKMEISVNGSLWDFPTYHFQMHAQTNKTVLDKYMKLDQGTRYSSQSGNKYCRITTGWLFWLVPPIGKSVRIYLLARTWNF